MLVSNGSLLNILLPNNNKVLNDVLKEADSKNLEQMVKSSTSSTSASTILKELFTSLKDGTKSNTTIENMLKNSATFKELGNVSTNLSSLVDELSTDENLQKFKPVLENFLKDVKNIDANTLKEQIKNSGIFLESKLSQTPNSKLENVLTQLQNLVKDINTPQAKQVNELIDKLLQNIKTQTNTNTQISQNQISAQQTTSNQTTAQNPTATNEFTNNLKTLTSSLQNLNNSLNPTQTQNLSNLANQLKSLINEGTLVESKIENSTNLTDKTTNLANNTTLKDSINLQTKELLTQIKNDIIQNPNMIQNKNILPMIDNLLKMDNLFSKNDTIQNFLANSNSSANLSTFTSNFASNLSPLLTTLKESLETLNPNNTHLQNHLTKLVDKVEHIIQDLTTTPNGKLDTKVSEDMKTVLLQMQDELASKTDPKSLEVAKQVDRLLTQIDLHQLTSLVSNSNYVYLPFFWEMLEDGSIEMKQKDEEKFFCQINLTLKDFGKVDLMLGLYDKNKLDLTIYAQREHFKTAIRENMQQLKIALNSVELIPVNVKLLDMKEDNKESNKPTQTYINNYNNQDLSSGIDIRA
ncbi:flagellar hook-length control protein FliK [Aliarcobacter butzleri]|uniref:flagellar hook-length control protein FliK n=1 Tax=Aliarcobacter butzleri TaxID=28197 RepID=UPI001EDFAFFB|nr:flagellar hook-length control protein FliK [Aliarcobacter butzleri]MCG3674258.1 flagellar hook-length control protein FliK [Aliarcobacter butzleri]MCG3696766.1 flagellar hook-length control protein FliK [Aliarcobacter butzleri]MCG3699942.1 flagellar hook-length control protein FliK [Aliarcobacter butzleri]MDN5079923.1 flagellar hook-length control protein FliK [Aliarcobacter butzleri]MDN5086871.1 flagellar hook-length control protein FliK [Aliarcobacter butzleri]